MQQPDTFIINALIVDDEERAADALRLMLEKFVPQVKQIAVCTDARQAVACITRIKPHLVFLDIKMPHLTGFEVLQQLTNATCKIVFTTAFNEFAIKAIRFSAFDYLLKPVDAEELIATVKRYTDQQKETIQQAALLQNMYHNINDNALNFKLALPCKDGLQLIQPGQILFCEGISNYTRFNVEDGKQYMTSKTLGEYEELLAPYHFLRCHKSYLVNKYAVTYIDNDGCLVLKNGNRLEVSKRRKAEVMKIMKG